MFRSPCPFFQPGSGSRRLLRSEPQLLRKSIQIGSHVNIVEWIYQTYRKLSRSSPRHHGFESTRRAHPIVFEKGGMAAFCPHEIVTAILSRSHHDVKTLE